MRMANSAHYTTTASLYTSKMHLSAHSRASTLRWVSGEGILMVWKKLFAFCVLFSLAGIATAQNCYQSSIVSPSPFMGNNGEFLSSRMGRFGRSNTNTSIFTNTSQAWSFAHLKESWQLKEKRSMLSKLEARGHRLQADNLDQPNRQT